MQIQRADQSKKKNNSNWQAKELKKIIPKSKTFGVYFFSVSREGNFL